VRRVNVVKIEAASSARGALDRSKWHQPLCTIIVTHHNYSRVVEDALRSVLDQTYANWECVVVDDFSTEEERDRLRTIVEGLAEPRIRLIQNTECLGQIKTFFAGLAETSGEFVSALDPDDRLHPAFLEEMVRAHLNETVFCPLACSEQKLLRINGALVTGTLKGGRGRGARRWLRQDSPSRADVAMPDDEPLLYFPCGERGWHWTTTSAMMMRRLAIGFLVPNKHLAYNDSLDAYLGFGTHFLGGTLLVRKPLVYRGVHPRNTCISEDIFSMAQIGSRADFTPSGPECRRDAVEAMFHNGVSRLFDERHLGEVLRKHFNEEQMALIGKGCPEALRVWRSSKAPQKKKRILPGFMRRLLKRRRPG
jgi:glycosyltransferase involved in cell wall biosynthesis